MSEQQARLANAAKEFRKTDITIGDVRFKIHKLLTMRAFDVLEKIRFGIGMQIDKVESGSSLATAFAKIVLSIPPDVRQDIQNDLFTEVTFSNGNYATEVPLVGLEDAAFESLSPFDVYEVLVRCLSVNFFGSLEETLSRLGLDLQNLSQSDQPTSTPSSPE